MAPQPVKIRSDFEITCFTPEGVDAIKESIIKGKAAVQSEDFDLQIKIISAPKMKCEIITLDKVKSI